MVLVSVTNLVLRVTAILNRFFLYHSTAWLLMKEFVRIHEAAKKEAEEKGIPFEGEYQTPKLSYYKVRQVSCSCF